MERRTKERFSPPALGGSSLLVVFAVLCLTVFALLSLSTVRADGRLGDAAADAVAGYYQADSQAQEILARLRAGEVPEGVEARGNVYAYSCPISQSQRLDVQVKVEGGGYQILRWQAEPSGNWEPDDKLEVWDSEE